MAVADQPSGLMDIASSLTQDDIPFKLRCAICNKLAVNAFRLPCCDQAICETCQAALPETCPVCAHTPISSDLCKPNKALRTTLKAFLRTEEKKREKERQSATPATPATTNGATTADGTPIQQETPAVSSVPEVPAAEGVSAPDYPVDAPLEEPPIAADVGDQNAENAPGASDEAPTEGQVQDDQSATVPADTQGTVADAQQDGTGEGEPADEAKADQGNDEEAPQGSESGSMFPNGMGFGMGTGMFPNMAWNNTGGFNPMAQFMNNGMFNFPNAMGMPGMAMDPMAANQGMFGGYGMNMNGMNMGMNFDAGQGMYGGWDSQNNMWNGGQDKFNPNAFANGMGSQYGGPSGFGGYNMSQPNGVHAQMQQPQFPSQDYQNGSYAGHGRGAFRGRGRGGVFPGGRGRGGFGGQMQANHPANANESDLPSHNSPSDGLEGVSAEMSGELSTDANKEVTDENAPSGEVASAQDPSATEAPAENLAETGESDPIHRDHAQELPDQDESQLRGIPTIDSLDQVHAVQGMPMGPMGMPGPMGPGFGRGGYMRGPFAGGRPGGFNGPPFMGGPTMYPEPRGQGVEGAPAAPRAMREGLPNTSVLRQRNFQGPGRSSAPPVRPNEASHSVTPTPGQEDQLPRSTSRSKSRAGSASRSRSRSRSPAPSRSDSRRQYRQRSMSANRGADEPERRRDRPRRPRREDKYEEPSVAAEDTHRTRSPSLESRRSTHRRDRERDRRGGRRSHRSRRHRSWSRSPSRNGEAPEPDRLSLIPEENGPSSRPKPSDSYRAGKDRSSRRDDDRDRDRDSRRRDRDRDRDRYRERERERERDRDRDRERERDRDRPRERDRKRSRRDRSESPVNSEYSSRHSRRAKRDRDEEKPAAATATATATADPEKDPHTLEREARNRERMLKEQQRREAMHADRDGGKSSRKRDGRALAGGRRFSYKYEDEENDDTRAARVEKEREAGRWK
ncbi:uncharacterized protein BO80DRAFT_215611 [Aspergillus ibericus CBS 121593]|uniref:RING-type domain-containing protein n=1 Tax=Aspergillus ibericus CBS 121593 TaxID=1448316 RepID=A0A395GMP6_9EURO|nr:hypothetical protein BO80DRAFT_215611 [Aspergillus ibericus CBS 121593]RAK96749.1 hypothetical protein BO80DRAFT_215611 [Aspergillus ibericus CBS 121593]